jgi:aryl-alcohol dehydrogenase-like predicted oxidoreductase
VDVDDNESIRAIHAALDEGVNFFDTADMYGAGHSEEVLGQALKGRRDRAVIATKFGDVMDPVTRQAVGFDARPQFIRESLEASLRRLGTDYVDLYQFHIWGYPAAEAVPVQETLEELTKEGKIRGYAWSTDVMESLEVLAEGPNCIAIQHELNLFQCDESILELCERQNLASINRSPLAMGVLTGKYASGFSFAQNDVRSHTPDYIWFRDGKPSEEHLQKLQSVREILTSGGRTVAQGALAWIWGRSQRSIPIPGFKTVGQAKENARAMQFGPLAPEQMMQIETLLKRQ